MQVAQRNLEVAYFNTGLLRPAHRRAARAAALPRRRPRRALGARPCVRAARTFREAVAEFSALLRHHPNDLGAVVQLGLAEKASGHLGAAQPLVRGGHPPRPRELGHAVLPGRGALQPGPHRGRARGAQARDRVEPRESRRAFPAELRVRRHGAARGGRGREQARGAAQPHRSRARRPTSRSTSTVAERYAELVPAASRAPVAAHDAGGRGRRARALQSRPRVPAEGLLRRGAARVRARARARRGSRRSCCRRWPKCTCCARTPRRRSRCTTR